MKKSTKNTLRKNEGTQTTTSTAPSQQQQQQQAGQQQGHQQQQQQQPARQPQTFSQHSEILTHPIQADLKPLRQVLS